MAPLVTGIGRDALRVTDLPRVTCFSSEAAGLTLVRQSERVGGVVIAPPAGTDRTAPGDRVDPVRARLDHLALTVQAAELPALQARRDAAGVRHIAIESDARSGADAITFYDPDDVARELYARAN